MTREERTQELNALRQKNPSRLIAMYREATNTPAPRHLPRGLGFTGMIEAILENEFGTGELPDEFQQDVEIVTMNTNRLNRFVEAEYRCRRARMNEFRAFCEGGAMVFAGLLLAALYLVLTHQLSG